MDVYEITDFKTGVSQAGVNYLQPSDSFQNIFNGYIYRQVLQSRQGIGYFAPRLAGTDGFRRIMGIFEHTLTDSTKQLLAFDQKQLYRYNTSTGIFDPIPFAGSMVAYGGFNISANDQYISGTSYPAAQFKSDGTNNPAYVNSGSRFVFTGEGITSSGGSSIFFYNGTDVRNFTSLVDNPNYADPPQGVLSSATYVIWFNERLNFVSPVIANVQYQQGVLYSGIRTSNGNGDKFNVPGSGLFQADTYQTITGISILGQILILNFNRMAYTLEKTTDAFNPYFGRALPGVLGTNAKFSAVSWDDKVRSLGKTGILESDGRRNLRVDNKIPYFTADQIDQELFNLTYGGFDRLNNQFLWSYKISESNTNTQNSVLVANYEEDSWSVYDQRFSVLGQTDLGKNYTWDEIDELTGNPSWARWDTTEEIWDRIGLGAETQKTLAGDDLGFIYELNQDYDDYFTTITGATLGATTTLTVAATSILAGDFVVISGVVGMLDGDGNSGINNFDPETNEQDGNLYLVLSATTTSIEIDLDSSLLTAYVSGGTLSKVITFYAETIPFNPYRSQGRRCFVSHVEFLLDTNGGTLKVDVFSDQEELPFKQNVLLDPTADTQSAEWIPMTVDQESNFITFALKQESPAVQLRLTSMRIFCEPGGMTSG